MAEILGKDLDNWDDSLAAREPYSLSESSTTGAQFMTGADLLRSAKISSEWRDPVAIYAQAYNPMTKPFQVTESTLTSAVDTVRNLPSNVANLGAQTFIELTEGEERALPDVSGALKAKSREETLDKLRKALSQSQQSIDEAVFLLKDRDYPVSKFARRVIADTTANVENRKIVRELYNQAHGIDSSKWYNEAGSIIGAMLPAMVAGNVAFSGARAFGAGRLASINTAKNIVKGYIGAEMAGQYAEETAAEYLARTGDKNFENFTAKDASGMMAAAYGAIGAQIEFMGGVEPVFAGALTKVGLRSGALKAAAKIGAGEATEELLQGLTETLMRKIDGTSDKTWKEGFEESLKGAAWGLFIGGTLGTTAFYTNRRNLVKGIKVAVPGIEEAQAELIADAMIDTTGEISSQEPSLRNNLRQKVALMYEDADLDNKEDRIDAITDLEYGLVAMDAAERGIDLAEHELFSGEVNELGWFRAGIPEARRVEIQEINDNIRDLKTQLKELNKAEQKDWAKIEEIENKLAQANQYVLEKLNDLARDDAAAVRRMFRGVEEKYVNKEKERATKQAIKSGSVDVIRTELQRAGFRTRDLSGTQIKELAKLNWELLQGKDLGMAQSRGTAQIPLTAIEQNVESGNQVLLRAGYTQDQIDRMDDETWNRAIQVQMRKEIPQTVEPEYTEEEISEISDALMFQEQFDIADENARLDDIYPEYNGETIEIDGKERTVYNSKGKRIAKSKEALTNFWRWFGDSKVVDSKGRPIVMYHGTRSMRWGKELPKFNEFSRDKLRSGQNSVGFFFGESVDFVKNFGDRIIPVYLKLSNPKIYKKGVPSNADLVLEQKLVDNATRDDEKYYYQRILNDTKKYTDPYDKFVMDMYHKSGFIPYQSRVQGNFNDAYFLGREESKKAAEKYMQSLKDEGFDGIIILDTEIDKNSNNGQPNNQYVVFDSNQIKSVDNRGTYSADTGNIYKQNKVSGAAPSTYRGAYIPQYRFILRANRMDASTLSHELAHDWFETNFARYRSGKATKDFMRAWGALEKALGVPENATSTPRQASEAFARAYEAWIVQNEDWAKLVNVEDKDRDAVEKLMKDYQNDLRDIYNDISNPYFKQTWGKLGELKPELKAWFDRVVNITDLDVMVERGEMTAEEAGAERLNRAIGNVIENTEDADTVKVLKEVRTLNDTQRYEAEGGNKNSLQMRLSALAREIDENNMLVKENYDTRRDMMAVAEAADNFVKTRLDDALAIINGQMAEVEGLYKEDLYTALERLAIENGDLGLIDELKNSEIANRLGKELGQRVAGFRNFKQSTDLDVVSALKSLDNSYNKALENKKAQKQFNEALDMLDKSLKVQDSIADKELDATLKELECK